jgi:hypothetical protein
MSKHDEETFIILFVILYGSILLHISLIIQVTDSTVSRATRHSETYLKVSTMQI